MGNLIFGTTTIQGRTFDDVKIQTSKAGVPRPIVFGTVRPIVGNIIATTAPRIETSTEEQDGGKGGPSVEVENEEIFRTYAIRICEGPVTGIRRVWRNNELVWVDDPEEYAEITYGGSLDEAAIQIVADTIQGNDEEFGAKVEFFLGSYTQMPSAVMQSAFGMDNVHAYRGTCYMVVDDDNLTSSGGAIPQYQFEVERCEGFVLTGRPYAVETSESLQVAPSVTNFNEPVDVPPENLSVQPSVVSINLRTLLHEYEGDPESLDIEPSVDAIDLTTFLQEYEGEPESLEVEPSVDAIDLQVVVVDYETQTESLDVEPGVDSIQVTTV